MVSLRNEVILQFDEEFKIKTTMKRNILKAATLLIVMMTGSSAYAQFDLGNILGGVVNSATSSSADGGNLISSLTSVFSSSKQASKKSIIGTWEYSEPAIVFQSDNILAQAGSKLVANKLETKIQDQLDKYGIKEGALKFIFKEDGSFTQTLGSRTSSGTWAVKNKQLNLTYLGVKTFSITTQLEGNKLMFVTDATKLLQLVKTIGSNSGNAELQTISSLMNSVKGMEAGLTLVKKR